MSNLMWLDSDFIDVCSPDETSFINLTLKWLDISLLEPYHLKWVITYLLSMHFVLKVFKNLDHGISCDLKMYVIVIWLGIVMVSFKTRKTKLGMTLG